MNTNSKKIGPPGNLPFWIWVEPTFNSKDCIVKIIRMVEYNQQFKTPQEAYSATFDYILKELI